MIFSADRVFRHPTALFSALISFSISVFYLVFNLIPSSPWQSLNSAAPSYFGDDRDLWLQFAAAFPDMSKMETLSWQLNFWPPGNIAVLTLGNFLFGSLLAAALLHVLLLALAQAALTYQCASLFLENVRNRVILFLIVFVFHLSFIYRSAFMDAALTPDYLASVLLCLACILAYKVLKKRKPTPFDFICISFLLALSGYIRVTTYQIVLLGFLLSITIILTLRMLRRKTSQKSISTLIIFTLSFLLFLPWITYRSIGIYENDFAKGLQFSGQARFALQHQWDTPADLATAPQLNLMGLGTACKIDSIKCAVLSKRVQAIVSGDLPITMDDEWDLRSREAIRTFLDQPLKWIQIKIEYFPQSYFQKSVYDSIDEKNHYSWDLVLVLVLFIYNIVQLIRKRETSSAKYLSVLQLIAVALSAQLLVTQSLLRFFLPSILLTILVSIVVSSVAKTSKAEKSIDQEEGMR
jgi:hypothetical protein